MSQPVKQLAYRILTPGDPAPWFAQRSTNTDNFKFDTVGGRFILLCFFVSANETRTKRALKLLEAHRAGIKPFCITIDEQAADYLPFLFGQTGYALVHKPQELVSRLTQIVGQLSA